MTTKTRELRRYRLAAATTVALLAVSSMAFARQWDPTCTSALKPDCASQRHFKPSLFVDGTHLVDTQASLDFQVGQPVDDDVVTQYDIHIPSGYRFAVGSIKPSSFASCAALNDADTALASSAEGIGVGLLVLDTTNTASQVRYAGTVWFNKWVPSGPETGTATFCIVYKGGSVPGAPSAIVSELSLVRNADRSWNARWNFKAAPGAAAGTRSITDNTAFQNANTSVESLSFNFGSVTKGNYNTDPGTGQKVRVPFTFSPFDEGIYSFDLTAYPCGTQGGDPVKCASSFSPVVSSYLFSLGESVAGNHPTPVIDTATSQCWATNSKAAGCLMKPIYGKTTITIKWKNIMNAESVRAYLVTTGNPALPSRIRWDRRVVNPSSVAPDVYDAAKDPCAPDGTAQMCAYTFDAATMPMSDGRSFDPNVDIFSTSIIAIFMDGHRSDGKCDDGTPTGYQPPCTGESGLPAWTFPGYTYVKYAFVPRPIGPLAFIEGSSNPVRMYFIDFDNHLAEYIEYYPNGYPGIKKFPLAGFLINGSNADKRGIFFVCDSTNPDGKWIGINARLLGSTTLTGTRWMFKQPFDGYHCFDQQGGSGISASPF